MEEIFRIDKTPRDNSNYSINENYYIIEIHFVILINFK